VTLICCIVNFTVSARVLDETCICAGMLQQLASFQSMYACYQG